MKKMVYSLALFLGSASAMLAQSATDKVNHAVARDSKVNQMFVTTNSGDVKYYNTADLASVKFEGNKTIVAPKDGSDNDEYDASVREINFAKRLEQGDNGGVENLCWCCEDYGSEGMAGVCISEVGAFRGSFFLSCICRWQED